MAKMKICKRQYESIMKRYNNFSEVQDHKAASEEIDILIEEDRWQDALSIMAIRRGEYEIVDFPELRTYLKGLGVYNE